MLRITFTVHRSPTHFVMKNVSVHNKRVSGGKCSISNTTRLKTPTKDSLSVRCLPACLSVSPTNTNNNNHDSAALSFFILILPGVRRTAFILHANIVYGGIVVCATARIKEVYFQLGISSNSSRSSVSHRGTRTRKSNIIVHSWRTAIDRALGLSASH